MNEGKKLPNKENKKKRALEIESSNTKCLMKKTYKENKVSVFVFWNASVF